ncbi:hypothetical protein ALI22I_17385 [Saccharothrix sp. ALI-22-I]|uniref:hypothetical protein n=1 Tax=Saccharothrix sp. ALI-22-I TaxID=1933778 RepID=UPI00097BDD4C|nr:hypothetical protein [Saccharothrix sp. ALI-22-I]ONI88766.1 hypothetical protein ALI22I_17385 [Saccharothrix sp. ALI-22-I]
MLPNWLYTQSVLPVELAAQAADPAADRAEVLARLSASPLADVGHREWEQIGRGLAALGAASPGIGGEFAEHLAQRYRGDAPRPYLVRAALLVSAAVGVASTAVRRAAASQTREVGEAATAVLTAQAALLRVLGMLDLFAATGREADATVSAGFHTVVRGAAQSLVRATELLAGEDIPADLVEHVHRTASDELIGGPEWSARVAETLVGNWSSFEGCV